MNKINRSDIRKLVIKEMSRAKTIQKRSLSSLLFEDVDNDIKTASEEGPAAVRKLVNSTDDKQGLKDALDGMYDKLKPDDVVNVSSSSSMKVGKLIPTQNEIDLMKSVAFPLGGISALEEMISTNKSGAPGSITVSGNEILDGHHRWSGVWGISGPDGDIDVQNIELPGGTSEKLAAAQLAIAAYKPTDTALPSASDEIPYNILGVGSAGIEELLLKNVGKQTDSKAPGPLLNDELLAAAAKSEIVANWAKFKIGSPAETVKTAIIKKVASNFEGLPSNSAAPDRADMPQLDDKSIGGKKAKEEIYAGLASGAFNISPPYSPSKEKKESSIRNDDQLIMERWQKLAGILKG